MSGGKSYSLTHANFVSNYETTNAMFLFVNSILISLYVETSVGHYMIYIPFKSCSKP